MNGNIRQVIPLKKAKTLDGWYYLRVRGSPFKKERVGRRVILHPLGPQRRELHQLLSAFPIQNRFSNISIFQKGKLVRKIPHAIHTVGSDVQYPDEKKVHQEKCYFISLGLLSL